VLNKIFVTFFALMLSAEISTACLAEDQYTKTAKVARKEAASALAAGAFSGTLAVVADGKIVYKNAFGKIGPQKSRDPDVNTQYNAGSIGKVFTAVAMLQLREQRTIDLDEPVTEYLPEFRMNDERYRQITIRTLLNHAAGIPGTNYYRIDAAQKDPNYVSQTLAVLRNSGLKSDPGDISTYCNDCFTVAEAVIGKSGRRRGLFRRFGRRIRRDGTRWRSEVNSNCRYRFVNSELFSSEPCVVALHHGSFLLWRSALSDSF
jgi:CubicO group peptidase (beta-lactamase class C family)